MVLYFSAAWCSPCKVFKQCPTSDSNGESYPCKGYALTIRLVGQKGMTLAARHPIHEEAFLLQLK